MQFQIWNKGIANAIIVHFFAFILLFVPVLVPKPVQFPVPDLTKSGWGPWSWFWSCYISGPGLVPFGSNLDSTPGANPRVTPGVSYSPPLPLQQKTMVNNFGYQNHQNYRWLLVVRLSIFDRKAGAYFSPYFSPCFFLDCNTNIWNMAGWMVRNISICHVGITWYQTQ